MNQNQVLEATTHAPEYAKWIEYVVVQPTRTEDSKQFSLNGVKLNISKHTVSTKWPSPEEMKADATQNMLENDWAVVYGKREGGNVPMAVLLKDQGIVKYMTSDEFREYWNVSAESLVHVSEDI